MTNNKALILCTYTQVINNLKSEHAVNGLRQTVTMAIETIDRYRNAKQTHLAEELENEVLAFLNKMLAVYDPGVSPSENIN